MNLRFSCALLSAQILPYWIICVNSKKADSGARDLVECIKYKVESNTGSIRQECLCHFDASASSSKELVRNLMRKLYSLDLSLSHGGGLLPLIRLHQVGNQQSPQVCGAITLE